MFVNNALCVLVNKNHLDWACIARAVLLSDLETGKVRRFSACQGHVSHRPHPTVPSQTERAVAVPFIKSVPCS